MAAFIAVVTGHFKGFILFSIIILVHEFGHVLMGILFGWKIDKIIILPFGALTVFQEDLNRRIFEEFLIVIMGPIFQIVFTWILCEFGDFNRVFDYSMAILCFNLLPIYPLDGSKLLNLLLNKIVSFKRSHALIIINSFLIILVLIMIKSFDLLFVLIILFLILKLFQEVCDHENLFNRFLLERFLKNYHFKKNKVIHSLDMSKMKRDYNHLFYNGKRYISERENLKKRFDFKGKV